MDFRVIEEWEYVTVGLWDFGMIRLWDDENSGGKGRV